LYVVYCIRKEFEVQTSIYVYSNTLFLSTELSLQILNNFMLKSINIDPTAINMHNALFNLKFKYQQLWNESYD